MAVPGMRMNETAFRCPAPAKVNLALHVTGLRADGYHQIETLAAFCEAGDRLVLAFDDNLPAGAFTLSNAGPNGPQLDALGGNIIDTAWQLLADRFPEALGESSGIVCRLEKNLPLASGLGGGSADAAAALLGLRRLLDLPVDDTALLQLGALAGSDVPMCLASHSLIATGRGEVLKEVPMPSFHAVLVNPGIGVSTPDVFAALERKDNAQLAPPPRAASFGIWVEWLHAQRNDLEAPARQIVPEIGDVLEALSEAGAAIARMSGSGASCFGLFGDEASAMKAARHIAALHPGWWCVPTRMRDFGTGRVTAAGRSQMAQEG